MRLLIVDVMSGCINANVAFRFELKVIGASRLVCQRQFTIVENDRDMVLRSRANERAWVNSLVN